MPRPFSSSFHHPLLQFASFVLTTTTIVITTAPTRTITHAFLTPFHSCPSRQAARAVVVRRQQQLGSGLSGDILRPGGDSTNNNDLDDLTQQLTSGGATDRPDWLAELMLAKESQIVRLPYELRQFEWSFEDDEMVDSLLRAGQPEEAQKYFEEKKATSVPIYRQTLRYHWTQTETELHVGVPVPKAVRGSNMHLIVAENALQMALIDDPTFGVVSGKFAGEVDPATSGWQLAQRPDGSYSVSMTLKKLAQPGTHSLWYQLLQGEKPATSLSFKGRTTEGYRWQQDLDYMNLFIPIPEDVRGKAVQLTIDAGGRSMEISYPNPEDKETRVRIGGEFSGLVAPDESSWVVDDDEDGQRCICLSLKKRRRDATESTWWPRCFRQEEFAMTPEMQVSLDEGVAKAQAERERFEKALNGDDGMEE